MTTFADVYSSGVVGSSYTVSDGTTPPPGTHNSREFNEWRGRNFAGTLVAKIAGPPRQLQVTLADFGVTVTITEPSTMAADNTAAAMDRQTLNRYSAVVVCDSSGNPVAGQLPVQVSVRRFKGTTDVTDLATWTCSDASATYADATFSFSTVTSDMVPFITSTYGGQSLSDGFSITRLVDSTITPPSGTSSSTFNFSGHTFSSAYTAVYTSSALTKHSGVDPSLSASVSFQVDTSSTDRDGTGYAYGRWDYLAAGDSTWTEVDTFATSESPCNFSTASNSGSNGLLTVNRTATGLTDGVVYQFRLSLAADTTTATSLAPPFMASASGSLTL